MQRPGLYIVLSLVLQVNNLNGQTLIGAYGGFNFSSFFQRPTILTHYYEADFDSKGSYLLGMHYKRSKASLFHLSLSLDYLHRKVFLDYAYGGKGGQTYSEYNVDIHSVNLRVLPGLRLGKTVEYTSMPVHMLAISSLPKWMGNTSIDLHTRTHMMELYQEVPVTCSKASI